MISTEGQSDLYTALLTSSPNYFGAELLEFIPGPHSIEWERAIHKHDRVAINAARDHSKCTTGDALILAADGSRVRTDAWRGGKVFAFNSETQRFQLAESTAAEPNGVRPVLRVRTRTGRTVTVTKNHPFLTFSGWRVAEDILPGTRIAVPNHLPVKSALPFEGAWLLGLLVGDGSLVGTTVSFSSEDPLIIRAAEDEVAQLGWQFTPDQGRYGYNIHNSWKRNDGPLRWIRDLGLHGKTSHTKRIPSRLFNSDKKSIAKFLAGYFDADGCVNPNGGGILVYGSVSKELLEDVRHLLLRLGIVAVLTKAETAYKGAPYVSWMLNIRSQDLVRFAQCIPLRSYKAEQLRLLCVSQKRKDFCSGPAVDLFPKEAWDLVQHSSYWFEKRGLPRPNRAYCPTRSKLLRIALAEENRRLYRVATSSVLWDEIVSIEDAGDQATWSVSVPGLENYVADDIVQHNSTFFSYLLPIWRAWREDNIEFFMFSKTQEQAIEFVDIIMNGRRNLPSIQDIPLVRERLFPLAGGSAKRQNKSDVRFRNRSRVRAIGWGKAVRGGHPKYVALDDPINDDEMWSEKVRLKSLNYFQSAISNLVLPGGQITAVGTPIHVLDLWGYLRTNPRYWFKAYPAIYRDANGVERALFPSRYSLKALYNKKLEIGSLAFAREILVQPITDDLAIFPSTLFPPLYNKGYRIKPTLQWIRQQNLSVYVGVDIAISANVGADYFVLFVIGVDQHGNIFILDIRRHKGMPYRDQLKEIVAVCDRYGADLVFVESNAMQKVWTSEIARLSDVPVKPFETKATNKYPLDKGVPSIRILLENQKFVIPRGDEESIRITDTWIAEMIQFGFIDGKLQGIGAHDDIVMALWFACEAAKAGGFRFSFGDDEGSEDDITGASDGIDWEKELLGSEEDDLGGGTISPSIG